MVRLLRYDDSRLGVLVRYVVGVIHPQRILAVCLSSNSVIVNVFVHESRMAWHDMYDLPGMICHTHKFIGVVKHSAIVDSYTRSEGKLYNDIYLTFILV